MELKDFVAKAIGAIVQRVVSAQDTLGPNSAIGTGHHNYVEKIRLFGRAIVTFAVLTIVTGSVAGCGDWPCKKGKLCGGACIAKHLDCHK